MEIINLGKGTDFYIITSSKSDAPALFRRTVSSAIITCPLAMPRTRPGWTPKESVYLRLGAIELLRVMLAGHGHKEYLDAFFDEWVLAHGIPVVPEGSTMEDMMVLYKRVRQHWHFLPAILILHHAQRVVSTIEWHALRPTQKTISMKARIHKLKNALLRDLHYLWDLPEDHPKASVSVVFPPDLGLEAALGNLQF